jgi:hypothetical protein
MSLEFRENDRKVMAFRANPGRDDKRSGLSFHSGLVAGIPGLKSETWGTLRFLPKERARLAPQGFIRNV